MANRVRLSLAANVFLAVMEPVVWCVMLFTPSAVSLTAVGLYSLKFFTVLSNLLLGAASLVYAIFLARSLRCRGAVPRWSYVLKFAATVATTVTLMTVLLFLGPTLGYASMFAGVNLWFHLILPVVAIADFVFFCGEHRLAFKETLFGVLPTLLYGIAYCGNIFANGVGTPPATNDWYGFAMWGVQFMPAVFAVMLFATWLFAVALRAGNNAVHGSGRNRSS